MNTNPDHLTARSDESPTDQKMLCGWRCWRGLHSELLSAPDPFNEGETLYACPECRSTDELMCACDEPDCWERADCGFPTTDGRYRHTCGRHYAKAESRGETQ